MSRERTVLIISDLHVGGGSSDPGDDHVYHDHQLASFIRGQGASELGCLGHLELFFNGDFLEFAQTNTAAYSRVRNEAWCTEAESLCKLDTILCGHLDIFEALAQFQSSGNLVTIALGNHDVDLFWPGVQRRLREVVGAALRFEAGKEWVERFNGLLQIGHGHMYDGANRFKHWERPVVTDPFGVERLEMCPGTLFMVKFVNQLEARYPFADNLLPVHRLASVLFNDDKSGFASVGWAFMRFIATSPAVLGAAASDDYGLRLLNALRRSGSRRDDLAKMLEDLKLYREQELLTMGTLTQDQLAVLMLDLLGLISDQQWHTLFAPPERAVLGHSRATLGALTGAAFTDGKEMLRKVARKRAGESGASCIVMGHTHQVDKVESDGVTYLNPGCWTRYWEPESGRRLTLDDLRDEQNYPYSLNAVKVECIGGELKASMMTIDRSP